MLKDCLIDSLTDTRETYTWIDKEKDRWMKIYMNRWMDGRVDRGSDRWTNRQTEGRIDG